MAPANQEQHRVTPLGFSKALPQEFRSGPASLISGGGGGGPLLCLRGRR